MRRVLSTRLFGRQRLTTALLDRLARADFRRVELHGERSHLDYRQRAQVDELRHWFRDAELRPWCLRTPVFFDENWVGVDAVLDIASTDKPHRIRSTDELKRALEIADRIPFRAAVLRLGPPEGKYSRDRSDAAFNALDELNVFARQLDVELLIENGPNDLSSGDRLMEFLGTTHLPVGLSFDSGEAAVLGLRRELEKMAEAVRVVRVRELLSGEPDAEPDIDWRDAMRSLVELPDDLPYILSPDPVDVEDPAALDQAHRTFDQLEEEQQRAESNRR